MAITRLGMLSASPGPGMTGRRWSTRTHFAWGSTRRATLTRPTQTQRADDLAGYAKARGPRAAGARNVVASWMSATSGRVMCTARCDDSPREYGSRSRDHAYLLGRLPPVGEPAVAVLVAPVTQNR